MEKTKTINSKISIKFLKWCIKHSSIEYNDKKVYYRCKYIDYEDLFQIFLKEQLKKDLL
jgi:hypothetical protein